MTKFEAPEGAGSGCKTPVRRRRIVGEGSGARRETVDVGSGVAEMRSRLRAEMPLLGEKTEGLTWNALREAEEGVNRDIGKLLGIHVCNGRRRVHSPIAYAMEVLRALTEALGDSNEAARLMPSHLRGALPVPPGTDGSRRR